VLKPFLSHRADYKPDKRGRRGGLFVGEFGAGHGAVADAYVDALADAMAEASNPIPSLERGSLRFVELGDEAATAAAVVDAGDHSGTGSEAAANVACPAAARDSSMAKAGEAGAGRRRSCQRDDRTAAIASSTGSEGRRKRGEASAARVDSLEAGPAPADSASDVSRDKNVTRTVNQPGGDGDACSSHSSSGGIVGSSEGAASRRPPPPPAKPRSHAKQPSAPARDKHSRGGGE